MAQPSGMKTKKCPFCGLPYQFTNYMRRSDGTQRTATGYILDDTHLRACYREQMKAQEQPDTSSPIEAGAGGEE